MEYDDAMDDEQPGDTPEDEEPIPSSGKSKPANKAVSDAEKSARKRIEELAERQRLRHEVDYFSDLDESDDSDLDVTIDGHPGDD